MSKGKTINLAEAFATLTFLPNRAPDIPDDDKHDAFALLAEYRDGAVFIGHYAGDSEWERHGAGDEIVYVLEGETTLFIHDGEAERPNELAAGEFIVVPGGLWHRFETPRGVKILSVTPQPTDHRIKLEHVTPGV